MKQILSLLLLVFSVQIASAQTYIGNENDIAQILDNTKAFSEYIKDSDYKMIGQSYTKDAKIFPNNRNILEGTEAILDYWKLPTGVKILHHKVVSNEIKILGAEAYDYGTYEGTTQAANGEVSSWKGKYVIVWKKVDGKWKMYLDIWNGIK